MSIEADIFSHLSTNVSLVAGRVYPLVMPQDAEFPSIVFTVVNDIEHGYMLCDGGNATRIQVDCYSLDYDETIAVKDEVKAALKNYKSYPQDLNNQSLFEHDAKLFRQKIDFNIKGN